MEEAEHPCHPRLWFFDAAEAGLAARECLPTPNSQLGPFHDLTMKAIFALVLLLLHFAFAQNDTSNCTNFACNAVEQSAATCNSQESTEQGFANCFCTDVLDFLN